MSKKISPETLLPVALELYKMLPPLFSHTTSTKQHPQYAKEQAESFVAFTLLLKKRLEEQEESASGSDPQ